MGRQCRVEKINKVVLLTINRPPLNTLSRETLFEIQSCLEDVEADNSVRALVITGAGDKMFSAGADVTEFAEMADPEKARANTEAIHELFLRIEAFPKPIIASINGQALGGGNELQMACHLVIASENAQFGLPEVRLGIIPGYGGTQRLTRLIGRRRALELLLSGEKITAQQALDYGMINKVVAQQDLHKETLKWAESLAEGPPLAIKAILDSVHRGIKSTLDKGLQIETENVLKVSTSQDAIEGISAFFTKRKPDFKGQ